MLWNAINASWFLFLFSVYCIQADYNQFINRLRDSPRIPSIPHFLYLFRVYSNFKKLQIPPTVAYLLLSNFIPTMAKDEFILVSGAVRSTHSYSKNTNTSFHGPNYVEIVNVRIHISTRSAQPCSTIVLRLTLKWTSSNLSSFWT